MPEVTGWKKDRIFVGCDWESKEDGMTSFPRCFGERNHQWSSSTSLLDWASNSKVDKIFNLDLSGRVAKALLDNDRLQNGICLGVEGLNLFFSLCLI